MSGNCWETGDGKTFGTKAEVSIYTGSSDPNRLARLMEAVGKPAWQLVWTDNGVVVYPRPLDYKTDFRWSLATPQDIREAYGGETPGPVSSEPEGFSGLLLMVLGLIGVSALANSKARARVLEGLPVEASVDTILAPEEELPAPEGVTRVR